MHAIGDLDHFFAGSWRRGRTRLHAPPIADEAALFDAVLRASEFTASRIGVEGEPLTDLRIYDDQGARMLPGDARFAAALPLASDRSAEGYRARLERELGWADFALILNNAQAYSYPLWYGVCAEFAEFDRRVPLRLPADHVEMEIFFGRYQATPFGVHRDSRNESFYFVASGAKRFFFWPRAVWESAPRDPHAYREHAGDAAPITLGPGQGVYWTPDDYHIAETPELSMALAVSYYLFPDSVAQPEYKRWFWRIAQGMDRDSKLAQPEFPQIVQAVVDENRQSGDAHAPVSTPVYTPILASADQFARSLARFDADELRYRMLVAWARRASARGYRQVPGPADSAPGPDQHVRSNPVFPLLSLVHGERRICACTGHVWTFPECESVRRLVELCQTIDTATPMAEVAAEAMARARSELEEEDIAALVETFCRHRVLVVVSRNGEPG